MSIPKVASAIHFMSGLLRQNGHWISCFEIQSTWAEGSENKEFGYADARRRQARAGVPETGKKAA
jgi:hypothetical protein